VPGLQAETTGFRSYEAVPRQLAVATLGITPYEPSTGTHCAFVAKTVEYLGLGLPVVSTPLESSLRYYAGLEAVKFPAADGASFAAAILDWLAQPSAARAAAAAPATRKVARELDWPVICRRAAEFTEQIVAGAACLQPDDPPPWGCGNTPPH
jgi:glycosyltransferase involved in cell wall biosynthesis